MGDESGYEIGKAQPVKLAAMEAEFDIMQHQHHSIQLRFQIPPK